MTQTLTVTKRDGRKESIDLGRIHEIIMWATEGSETTSVEPVNESIYEELGLHYPSYMLFAHSLKARIIRRRVELKFLRAAVTAIGIFLELHYRRFAEQVGISVFRIVLKPCIVRPSSRSPPVWVSTISISTPDNSFLIPIPFILRFLFSVPERSLLRLTEPSTRRVMITLIE